MFWVHLLLLCKSNLEAVRISLFAGSAAVGPGMAFLGPPSLESSPALASSSQTRATVSRTPVIEVSVLPWLSVPHHMDLTLEQERIR